MILKILLSYKISPIGKNKEYIKFRVVQNRKILSFLSAILTMILQTAIMNRTRFQGIIVCMPKYLCI